MEKEKTKKVNIKATIAFNIVIWSLIIGAVFYFQIPNKIFHTYVGIKDVGGYELIEKDIKNNLYVSSSYKVESVYYKHDIISLYTSDNVDYIYKISYQAKNKIDMTIHETIYYGYNSKTNKIYNYYENSSKYNSISSESVKVI